MAFLTFKEILELVDRVADRGIGLVEVESAGLRVRVEGKGEPAVAPAAQPSYGAPHPAPAVPAFAPPVAGEPVESDAGLHIVTSPIVGTFYRAPNPEAEAFVSVGDRIGKGKSSASSRR